MDGGPDRDVDRLDEADDADIEPAPITHRPGAQRLGSLPLGSQQLSSHKPPEGPAIPFYSRPALPNPAQQRPSDAALPFGDDEDDPPTPPAGMAVPGARASYPGAPPPPAPSQPLAVPPPRAPAHTLLDEDGAFRAQVEAALPFDERTPTSTPAPRISVASQPPLPPNSARQTLHDEDGHLRAQIEAALPFLAGEGDAPPPASQRQPRVGSGTMDIDFQALIHGGAPSPSQPEHPTLSSAPPTPQPSAPPPPQPSAPAVSQPSTPPPRHKSRQTTMAMPAIQAEGALPFAGKNAPPPPSTSASRRKKASGTMEFSALPLDALPPYLRERMESAAEARQPTPAFRPPLPTMPLGEGPPPVVQQPASLAAPPPKDGLDAVRRKELEKFAAVKAAMLDGEQKNTALHAHEVSYDDWARFEVLYGMQQAEGVTAALVQEAIELARRKREVDEPGAHPAERDVHAFAKLRAEVEASDDAKRTLRHYGLSPKDFRAVKRSWSRRALADKMVAGQLRDALAIARREQVGIAR